MRCPFCGNIDTQVKDSRPAEDHVSIRRRRFCPLSPKLLAGEGQTAPCCRLAQPTAFCKR